MKNKTTMRNFVTVLDNIHSQFKNADNNEKKEWVNWLNSSLNELLYNDFFGTEGQNDPRGDQRN